MTLTLFATILVFIILIIWYFFIKNSEGHKKQNIHLKFKTLADSINQDKLDSKGEIEILNENSFYLRSPDWKFDCGHEVFFEYSTGHLTINWRFKNNGQHFELNRKYNYLRDVSHAGQLAISNKVLSAFEEDFESKFIAEK